MEIFTLSIFVADSDARFLEVIPELSTSVVYIVDDEGKCTAIIGLPLTFAFPYLKVGLPILVSSPY